MIVNGYFEVQMVKLNSVSIVKFGTYTTHMDDRVWKSLYKYGLRSMYMGACGAWINSRICSSMGGGGIVQNTGEV